VVLTPHIMEDYPNETSALRLRFEELKAAYNGPVTLRLAAENMLDNLFLQRLEANDLLLWDEGLILVETSYYNPPYAMNEMLSKIMSKGLRPILAHPERYEYMDKADYDELYIKGVRFQLNILSLTGAYGPAAKVKAEMLLKKGYYSYKGTDIHSLRSFLYHSSKEKVSMDILDKLK
ncbi:MAG: capsular biosynthesis protein, partial [Bacteroidales bacterium]|nr:capsular biosynthesis protein [Bacteroidales bacterium]